MTPRWLSNFSLIFCCAACFLFPGNTNGLNLDNRSPAKVSACTELALDSALSAPSAAPDGTYIIFDCSGSIPITSTKIISRRLTLEATGQSVILKGTSLVFKIARQGDLTLSHLTLSGDRRDSTAIFNDGTLVVNNSVIIDNSSGIVNNGQARINQTIFTR